VSRQPPGGALPVRRAQKLESLLSDLGSRITRGADLPTERCARATHLPVGRSGIDRLLGGGFPVGALSEISGAASSGRTTLALSLLAATTRRGELVGWVDGADAFDPPSAERSGVDLERVLWVRSPGERDGLAAVERLLRTEGFPLVLLDWTSRPARAGTASWLRLTRLAAASRTTLLLLSDRRLAGPHAALAIEMQPARPRFSGTPSLLEELETRMVLVRNRAAPVDPSQPHPVSLSLRESAA
jgi:hypothetical protein